MLWVHLKYGRSHTHLRKNADKDTLVYGSHAYINTVQLFSKTIFCKVPGKSWNFVVTLTWDTLCTMYVSGYCKTLIIKTSINRTFNYTNIDWRDIWLLEYWLTECSITRTVFSEEEKQMPTAQYIYFTHILTFTVRFLWVKHILFILSCQ